MAHRAALLGALAAVGLSVLSGCEVSTKNGEDTSSADTDALTNGTNIAVLALANVGHSACGKNTQGGVGYASSC